MVAGMVDPDPRVSGYGLQYLRDNGVVVNVADGLEAEACRSLNAPFVFRVLTEKAYAVVLTSTNREGEICNPFCEKNENKNKNGHENENKNIKENTNGKNKNENKNKNKDTECVESGSSSNDITDKDLSTLVNQLAPEINAVVLTSSQFLLINPNVLNSLASHIAVAITVSSVDEQLTADIMQVRTSD